MTVRPSSTDCCGLSLFSAQAPPHRVPVLKGGSTIPSLVVTTVVAAAAGKGKTHHSRNKNKKKKDRKLFPLKKNPPISFRISHGQKKRFGGPPAFLFPSPRRPRS